MPKSTFFNLPKEKADRILKAAVDEFVSYAYDQASINRIVEGAGIPKGSFYQYFEDKTDLYGYVLECSVREKIDFISPMLALNQETPFFEAIRQLFSAGFAFAKAHPHWVVIGERFLKDPNHPAHEAISQKFGSTSEGAFESLLARAAERGEIRQGVNPKVVSLILTEAGGKISASNLLSPEEAMAQLEDLLNILEQGIGKKKTK